MYCIPDLILTDEKTNVLISLLLVKSKSGSFDFIKNSEFYKVIKTFKIVTYCKMSKKNAFS